MYSNSRLEGELFQQWVGRGIDRGGKQVSPRCPRGAAATTFSGPSVRALRVRQRERGRRCPCCESWRPTSWRPSGPLRWMSPVALKERMPGGKVLSRIRQFIEAVRVGRRDPAATSFSETLFSFFSQGTSHLLGKLKMIAHIGAIYVIASQEFATTGITQHVKHLWSDRLTAQETARDLVTML